MVCLEKQPTNFVTCVLKRYTILAVLRRDNLQYRLSNVSSPVGVDVTRVGLPIRECVAGRRAERQGDRLREQPR